MTSDRDSATTWDDVVRGQWDSRAPEWNERSQRNRYAPDRPADIARTMAALNIGVGSRLLDAGCGTGQYALAFAERGCAVTAVDLSDEMIAHAEKNALETNVSISFHRGSIATLPASMAIFDAVHARVVLQFSDDVPTVLHEFRRVLKPGGRLYASVPGAMSPIYARSWERHLPRQEPAGINYMVPWELEHLLHAHGWQVLDQWGEYGESGAGLANPVDPDVIARLPLQAQQAMATTWALIAH